MLAGLLRQSFRNQKRAMALMTLSVTMGTAVIASLLALAMDIKNKVSVELRSFGANIVVEPAVEGFADIAGQRRYLREEDVPKAKIIFWKHNVVGLAPFLRQDVRVIGARGPVTALGAWFDKSLALAGAEAPFRTGTAQVLPGWDISGDYPGPSGVLLGVSLISELGLKKGDTVVIDGRDFVVSGTVSTGGEEDSMALMDLDALQALTGLEGKVSRVLVSAITTPMDDFAYNDPNKMSLKEYEKWYCTGYVTSIAKQIEEKFQGSRARPIWNVAETEGKVLGRLTVLIYLITAFTFVAAALGMSTTMIASLLKRQEEIALMKSIGADSLGIIWIFLAESLIIGTVGALLGYGLSFVSASIIGTRVFGAALSGRAVLLPVAFLVAYVISAAGSVLPIRRALGVKPAMALKGAQ